MLFGITEFIQYSKNSVESAQVPKLTRPEAVTLATYALGGTDSALDTEDIAVRVAELSPGMFSWQKDEYRDRIDKELVRVALSDARLKKKFVVGSHDKGGWMLTPQGRRFAERNMKHLEGQPVERGRGRDERQHERERVRLLSSDAFEQFQKSGDPAAVTDEAANAFFRIDVYVKGQARERKVTRVVNYFNEDPELGELVHGLADRVLDGKD
jgi:hypothetical protein